MSRREYTIRLQCTHEGCTERSFTTASTRREETEIRQHYAKSPYRCTRHTAPDEVLSLDNLERTTVLVSNEKSYGKFWDRQGFVYGPGFQAYASDFPEGTRLIISARIELPEESRDA